MNTSLGYAKRTLTDTSVLLSGGGDKPLSNFIGSISWDSTNKKITYTPVGGNATDLVSFGSYAFKSSLVTSDIPDLSGIYLPKLTYEYNKEIAFGSTGKLLIGKFPCYDTNVTIDIDSTTHTTYHATAILATQNINTSHGGLITFNVYGDASNTVAPNLYLYYPADSRYIEIYFSPAAWSKNLIHIRCNALSAAPTDICKDVDSIPSSANVQPTNMLTSTFAPLSHTHDYMPWNNVSSLNANDVSPGWYNSAASITNAAHTNHSSLLYVNNVGTPYQLQIPDSNVLYIYKRWYNGSTWSAWSKISAGYADSAGNADTVDNKHATDFAPAGNYVPYETTSTRASVDGTNSYPKFYNLENNNLITGYLNYWHVLNMGKYSGNNYANQIAMPYQNEITDTDLFIRSAKGTSWRAWRKVLHDGNTYVSSGEGVINGTTITQVSNADTVDGYHNTSFEGYYKTTIDASALDANTWYPVVMYIGVATQTRIRIEGRTNAPGAWNARSDKLMALMLDYTTQGSYWGWISPFRTIFLSQHGAGASGAPNIGNIGQLTNSSREYVYVRGGAIYDFYLSHPITPEIKTETYTVSSQSVAPTTTAPTAPSRNNALISDITWDNLSGKPSSFTPSTHDHDGRYIRWSNATADTGAMTWGTLTSSNGYNILSHCSSSDGGDMGWCYKGGQIFYQIDGFFYQNEGKYRCLDTNNWTSYISIPTKVSQLTNDSGFITSSGSCASATNIAGGAQGSIPYQTAAGTTAFLAGGTNGYVLAYSTTNKAPYWKADSNTQYYLTLNGTTKGTANTNDLGTIYAPTSSGTGFLKCSVSGTTVTWSYDNSTYLTSHYTAIPVLGGSSATSNATSNTSDPYLNIIENSTKSGGIQLKGGGSTSVTAKNGIATISSTNTQYYLTLNGSVNGTASTNNLGTIYAPTSAGTGFLKGTAGANGTITWSWDNSTYNNYSLPTATASALGGVKVGTTLTSDTGYTKVHIKDGFIYYKDTNTWQAANTSQVGYVPSTSANTMLYANSSGSATWGTPDLYEVNVGGNVDTAETLTEKIAYGGVLGFYFGGGMLGWLDEDGVNINHASSVLGATTIGSSTASSGSTVDIPYIQTDEYGHVTAGGTHTHTISVSGYLPTGGGELTGSLTLPKTTQAIKFNTRTGAGIKYDYGGNEALMISARAYSAASILLYAGESSTTRSLDNNSGQWSAGSSASNYMGVPNMQIKNGSVLINTAVQTGTLSGEYANALYVTGNAYLKGSSGSDNGMLTHNGTRYALFGTGASGATGIWVQGIGNDGWIVGVNPSGTPFFNGNANSATSATSATSASYASYLTFDSSKTCASANHSFTYYNTNTATTSSSTNGVANPEASKWFHHISMVRGDSSGYFFDLAFSLSESTTPRIYFRNRAASNYSTWKEIVTSANYTEYFTGGGGSIDLNHKTFSSLGSSTYYRLAYVYQSGTSNTTLSTLYYTSGLYVNNSGVYHTSDIAYKEAIRKYLLKKNVLDLENPVKKFKWKGTNDEAVGFIAQETEEWCPEAVGQDEEGYKTVNYTVALSGLCSALYDEVKTLRKEIEELKNKK